MLRKLEALRGVAAVMVVLYHSNFYVWEGGVPLVKNSWLFVDFFFVLSGYVMCLAYREKIRNQVSFGIYIGLRLFRLFPLHAVVLLAWLPIIGAKLWYFNAGYGGVDPSITENTSTFFVTFFLLNSLGLEGGWNPASWSISAELVAYTVFFFVVRVSGFRALPRVALFIAALFYAIGFSYKGPFSPYTWDFGFLRSIPAFFLGVWVYHLKADFLSVARPDLAEMATLILIALSISMVSTNIYFAYVAVICFVISIRVFSQHESGILGRLLESKPMLLIGKYSYSIYMVHMLVLVCSEDILEHILGISPSEVSGFQAFLLNLGMLIVIFVCSKMTYNYVELVGNKWGRDRLVEYKKPFA
ncbi:hypothetical protein A3715_07915 [Oleiphilus sp. HI0009]|nr:hypothetical protein A3715_07915 [Oleiphilus sp. HI0009]